VEEKEIKEKGEEVNNVIEGANISLPKRKSSQKQERKRRKKTGEIQDERPIEIDSEYFSLKEKVAESNETERITQYEEYPDVKYEEEYITYREEEKEEEGRGKRKFPKEEIPRVEVRRENPSDSE
jgi:hypothetical protein